jgi:hypothetical protein
MSILTSSDDSDAADDAGTSGSVRKAARSRVFGRAPSSLPMARDGTFRVPAVLVALRRAFLADGGLTTEGVFRYVFGRWCAEVCDRLSYEACRATRERWRVCVRASRRRTPT